MVFLVKFQTCPSFDLALLYGEHFQDAAEASFLLMTQIAYIYKLEMFYKNRNRIRACIDRLDTKLFKPQNFEEDEWDFGWRPYKLFL